MGPFLKTRKKTDFEIGAIINVFEILVMFEDGELNYFPVSA